MEQKQILLTEITPDPNQPRKFYDEAAMHELTDSVREKGILQPILVRPNGKKGYLLVCGERRYRAAMTVMGAIKDRNSIPAVIRELTDDEALELQIIENLQRKDVHPMEEAVAFKSLLEKGKEVKEIAARVGKSDYYVRQRLKLNDLIKEWQKAFFNHQITAILAIKIAGFDEKTQKDMWKDEGRDNGPINPGSWFLNRHSGNLSKASFDLSDNSLDKKAGPCTSCQFNSAVASLFPEAAENPVCSKISCYKHKSDIHFDKALKIACEDPEIVLVVTTYSGYQDNLTRKLEKEGHSILNGYGGGKFEVVEEPEKPVYNEDEFEPEDYDSEKERLQAFEDELKLYQKNLAAFKNKIEGGKLKKGFSIHGDDKGKIVYLQIGKASSSKAIKGKEASADLTANDINDEIKRIQDREKRAKELDGEKVQIRIIDAVKADKSLNRVPQRCENIDPIIIRFLLNEYVNFSNCDKVKKVLGIAGVWSDNDPQKLWDKLAQLTDQQVTYLIRQILIDKYAHISPKSSGGYVFRRMAMSLGSIPIIAFEQEQQEAADKRAARVAARIKQLQDKKKELAAPKKSAPKKEVKK